MARAWALWLYGSSSRKCCLQAPPLYSQMPALRVPNQSVARSPIRAVTSLASPRIGAGKRVHADLSNSQIPSPYIAARSFAPQLAIALICVPEEGGSGMRLAFLPSPIASPAREATHFFPRQITFNGAISALSAYGRRFTAPGLHRPFDQIADWVGKSATTVPLSKWTLFTSLEGSPSYLPNFCHVPSRVRRSNPPVVPAHSSPSGESARQVICLVEVNSWFPAGIMGVTNLPWPTAMQSAKVGTQTDDIAATAVRAVISHPLSEQIGCAPDPSLQTQRR